MRLSEDKHLVVPHQRIHSRQPVGTGLRHSGGGDNVWQVCMKTSDANQTKQKNLGYNQSAKEKTFK